MAEVDDDLLADCLAACRMLNNGPWVMVCQPWVSRLMPWKVGPVSGPSYRGRTPDSACRKWLRGYKRAARE